MAGCAEFRPVVGDIFEVEASYYKVVECRLPHRSHLGPGFLTTDTLELRVVKLNEAELR